MVTPIVSDVAAIDGWWRRLDPGRTLRFDLFPFANCTTTIGALDVADVTLPQPADTFADDPFQRIVLGLSQPPYRATNPQRKYLVYWDAPVLRRARLRPGECDRHRDHLPARVRARSGKRRPERGGRGARVDPFPRRSRLRLSARVPAAERRPRVRRHDRHPLSLPELRSRRAAARRRSRRLLRVRRSSPTFGTRRGSSDSTFRNSRSPSRPAAPARDASRATPARSTARAPARRPRSKDSR